MHPVRQWMEEYQESFAQLSRSFCMVRRSRWKAWTGESGCCRLRLTENRMAAAGQIQEMSRILDGRHGDEFTGRKEDRKAGAGDRTPHAADGCAGGIRFFSMGRRGKKRQIYLVMQTRRKKSACR